MSTIFRPFTPPRALTYLKYASAPRATEAYADAAPDSGEVVPRRIDVGVTPGSADERFGPARAAVTPVASVRTSAVSANAILLVIG